MQRIKDFCRIKRAVPEVVLRHGSNHKTSYTEERLMADSQPNCACDAPQESLVEYRPVADFPGYRVGSDGSVWSAWRRGWQTAAIGSEWRRLIPSKRNKYGHLVVTLCRDGKRFNRYVHGLVAREFLGPCPDGLECCHENGNPSDCAVRNLRYDTHTSNMHDKVVHGTIGHGEKIGTSKLTEEDVREIRACAGKELPRVTAQRYGVTPENIRMIISRKSWAHVD